MVKKVTFTYKKIKKKTPLGIQYVVVAETFRTTRYCGKEGLI